jgi:hypothetical protein
MARWKPINRVGKPEVTGTAGAEMVNIRIRLSSDPSPEWIQYFVDPIDVSQVLGGASPRVEPLGLVFLVARDGEEANAVKDVDARIESANRSYEKDIVEPRKAQADQRDAEVALDEGRVKAAQKRLKDL